VIHDLRFTIATGFAQAVGLSAEGAEYDSQGQAPNNVRRVAPGKATQDWEALKERNNER